MTELCDIATTHHTDKAPWGWGYTTTYFEWLEPMRNEVKTVLEMGVWQGASLRTWRDYFPNAMIYGIDNDGGCMVEGEPRIKTFCCNGYDLNNLAGILAEIGPIDFFVDDALHFTPHQKSLIPWIWPHMRAGGVYAIEETPMGGVDEMAQLVPTLSDVGPWKIVHAIGPYYSSMGRYALTIFQKSAK